MTSENYGAIYKITNLVNGKVYIGQHKGNTIKDIERYIKRHFAMALGNYAKVLYNDIRRYGAENFKSEIVHWCYSLENLNEMEIFYIKLYKSNLLMGGHGYNAIDGGQPAKIEGKDKPLELTIEFTEEDIKNMEKYWFEEKNKKD